MDMVGDLSRVQLVVVAAVGGALSSPAIALAGHEHHHPAPEPGAQPGVSGEAMVELQVGQVEQFGETRDYRAIGVGGGCRLGRFEVALHVPLFWIELGTEWRSSVGDPHLAAQWAALSRPWLEAGPSLAIMVPAGDDDLGLGMGHWMTMAGGFARARQGRLSLGADIAYARILGDSAGHAEHGGGVWPPIMPMNAQEVSGSLAGAIELAAIVAIGVRLTGSLPIGDGERLGFGALTAAAHWHRLVFGLELGHGLLGNPIGVRAVSHAALAF